MATAIRTEPFIWMAWSLALFGWILMLAAAAALQQNCNSGNHNAVALGGVVGFLGPVSCSKFYGYTWWIVWYLFLAVVLVPSLLAADAVSKFRVGLLGLLGPLTMLVGDVANTFLYFNNLTGVSASSTFKSRARTMGAGAIIASFGLYLLIAMVGLVDEREEKVETTGEPKGETYGGRYEPKPGATASYNPAYNEPVVPA